MTEGIPAQARVVDDQVCVLEVSVDGAVWSDRLDRHTTYPFVRYRSRGCVLASGRHTDAGALLAKIFSGS